MFRLYSLCLWSAFINHSKNVLIGLISVFKQVEQFIQKKRLIVPDSTIIVGVSGGPDSLALLHFLWAYKNDKNITIVAVHVDHMFRGRESEEDLLHVKDFCEKFSIPFESVQLNVKAYQKERKLSPQVAARECRYQYFEQVMIKYRAEYLALGHHGDDQIETMLMRLVRGTTGLGYAGILAKRLFATGHVIRPLLCVTKEDILAYCKTHHLDPRFDPSNDRDDYTRNRFRHHVLPFLKEENQQIHKRFQQFSEKLEEDERLLEELTLQRMNTVIKKKEDKRISVDVKLFQSMPKPLQRRGIQLILNYLYKNASPNLSSIHIDHLLSLLENKHPSGVLHFPNQLRIIRSYDECHFTFLEKRAEPFCILIEPTSTIRLKNGDELVSESWEDYPSHLLGGDTFIIDPDLVSLPLYIRSRKNGDKMTIKGMKGRKKVKDIFIDEKVERQKRDTWPIIVDSNGEILWLPFLKKSSYEAMDRLKKNYILLKLRCNDSRGQ